LGVRYSIAIIYTIYNGFRFVYGIVYKFIVDNFRIVYRISENLFLQVSIDQT